MTPLSQKQVFKRLMTYLMPYKALTVLALTLLLGNSLVRSYIPLVASRFIDDYIKAGKLEMGYLLIIYYALYVLQTLLRYFGTYVFAKVSYALVRDIRHDAFAKMEELGMSYFDKTPSGSIVSRITNDTESIAEMFSGLLSNLLTAVFIFVVTFYTMLTLNVRLTLMIALFLPVIVLLVNRYRQKSAPVVTETRSLLSTINSKLAESIEGIRIIQAFSQEARLQQEFEAINEEHLQSSSRSVSLDSLFLRPAMSLLQLLAYTVLMAYFGLTWQTSGLSAGLMYAFIQYVSRLFNPLIEVTQNFSTLQTSMVSAGRVFALIDEQTFEPSQSGHLSEVENGEICFEEVSFSYDGQTPVLDKVSFKAKAGQTIAFVGATGSGKSSIINLLMRFYDFQSGRILIDGQDIRTYSKSALRQAMGLVLQEPFLYHGTVKSNIAMYQDLSQEEVEAAAAFVDADLFIRQLPLQYDQPVTERGTAFSTGQRQLIAFARTIASSPKILILDEATANIDSATEQLVQDSLAKMRQGRTTIAIAHRLSTIQDADCIYVLNKGKIIESGSHEDLLALKGTYHKMYRLQAGQLK